MNKTHLKKLYKYTFVIFVCVLFSFAAGCSPTEKTAYKTSFIMSTALSQQLTGEDAEAAAKRVEDELIEFENTTSMYIASSDIGRINADAGNSVSVSESTYYMLSRAAECSVESDGIFDVTIGALTLLWDINGENPSVPDAQDIDGARSLVDYRSLLLNEENGEYEAAIEGNGGAVDLGGIAKGYALDICRSVLETSEVDYGYVSIGGNVLLYGDKAGKGFNVGIRNPEKDSESYFCVVNLANTVISTTGGYERFFVENGVTYHHVLDPRTGYPAKTDLLSASVICEEGLRADFMSTWFYILGRDKAIETANGLGVPIILVDDTNTVYASKSLEGKIVDGLSDTKNYTFKYI